jgi:GTPase SAR1 family protein
MNQVKTNNSNENVVVLLVGNKCDVEDRQVSVDQAKALAKEFNLNYFETSALTNYNIDAAFAHLAEEIIKIKTTKENKFKTEINSKPAVKIEDSNINSGPIKPRQKKCC